MSLAEVTLTHTHTHTHTCLHAAHTLAYTRAPTCRNTLCTHHGTYRSRRDGRFGLSWVDLTDENRIRLKPCLIVQVIKACWWQLLQLLNRLNIYIYIYIYVCVCVCVRACVRACMRETDRKKDTQRQKKREKIRQSEREGKRVIVINYYKSNKEQRKNVQRKKNQHHC